MPNRVTNPLPDGQPWADTGTHKQCRGCHIIKPREEFYTRRSRCKICVQLEVRTNIYKDVKKHRERSNNYTRSRDPQERYAAHIRNRYGLQWKDYITMMEKYNGACWICRKECVSGQRLAVDHNHETGEIRGLLCGLCNKALGVFEKEDLLDRAKQYLRDHG